MTDTTKFSKLPGVLSFTRRMNVTDCLLYSLMEDGSRKPLPVMRTGLRGTQNLNRKSSEGRLEVSNIQVTDMAKTDAMAVGVIAEFGLSFYPIQQGLNSCALSKSDDDSLLHGFKASLEGFIERTTGKESSVGLKEVANRYARNVANGRWLWRNRQYAEYVNVRVICGVEVLRFKGIEIPMDHFSAYSEDELRLGVYIADCLAGRSRLSIRVEAELHFGDGMNASMEVYPSQNYLGGDRPKGFSRSLYAVGSAAKATGDGQARLLGQAAIRDSKVANALRTIDTWYPEFTSQQRPIPVEPCGANLDAQRLFRGPKVSAFASMRRLNLIEPDSEEGMFMIASLVRGGVYSEGDNK